MENVGAEEGPSGAVTIGRYPGQGKPRATRGERMRFVDVLARSVDHSSMVSMAGLSAALGGAIVSGARLGQHMRLRVKTRAYTDSQGRATPYLELGEPVLGTLVWLHGFGDRPDTFLPTAASLAKDYRILIPALPGFSGWLDQRERHTFDAYVGWLEGVLLDIAGPRFHLMGNSLGGAITLSLAGRMKDRVITAIPVNSSGVKLLGVDCVGGEMSRGENLFEVRSRPEYDAFVARVFSRPPKLPRSIQDFLYREQTKNADWYRRVVGDLIASPPVRETDEASEYVDLSAIGVPTLVVWGEHDTLFPLAHARYLEERIAGAEQRVIQRCGHCPHLERPAELARAFREFAERR